jgi:curved DNA-binding protein
MTYKNYYTDLGIASTATPGEIKKAYRSLAKKYHPDKAKGDKKLEEKFKAINEANEVLSDPAKRKKYDQFGAEWKQYEAAGAKPGGFDWSKYAAAGGGREQQSSSQNFGQGFEEHNVNDLFEMLFGQRNTEQRTGGQRSSRRHESSNGGDLETETTLSFEEAYHGAVRLIQVNGETIKVTIKPGITDHQILRIAGKGGKGRGGGANGDILITINVAQHPVFQRFGNDLRCSLPVDLYTAILGGKSQIAALKGKIAVAIQIGTQNGKELKLKGLGMPIYGRSNEYGDLIVTIAIMLPEHLREEEIALFTSLALLRSKPAAPDAKK